MKRPDVETIEARAGAATEGYRGWYINGEREEGSLYEIRYDSGYREFGGDLTKARPLNGLNAEQVKNPYYWEGGFVRKEDAEFAAHARTDVPALIAYIRHLEGRIQDQLNSGAEKPFADKYDPNGQPW